MKLAELFKQHPIPWKHGTGPGGLIRIFDAASGEVPLMTLIGFTESITLHLSQTPQKEEKVT